MFRKNKALPGATPAEIDQSVLMAELARDYMHDKKVRRRWRMLFGALILLYLFTTVWLLAKGGANPAHLTEHTALVELNGPIGTEIGVSSDQINKSLRKAFEADLAKGVVLRINSPGGTPVQSAEINAEMTRLKSQYPNKPLYVVVSDMCASGGYFVAAAADQIFANRSSIVGSIGVRMDSFGFVDALEKIGVERRSITAGANKAMLDPFLPVKAEQRDHAQAMLAEVHQHFVDVVVKGRGEKLSENPDLFSGLFWTGEKAFELGLIDGFETLDSVARDLVGAEEVVDYTVLPSFLDQFSRQFGVAIGAGIGKVLGGSVMRVQ